MTVQSSASPDVPHVVLVTSEPLPLPGLPATGAGLRAWGLAEGLRTAGLRVTLLMPTDALATFPQTEATRAQWPEWVATFERAAITEAIHALAPSVVVFQHWGLIDQLGELDCPLAIDLAGPHLLERMLWGSQNLERDLAQKIAALRRADFLVASGEDQRRYFLAFALLAGWPAESKTLLPVIPFSMSPAPSPAPLRHDRFVYGGFFLPWQDPSMILGAALDAMDAADAGELIFVGGAHPSSDVSRGRFEPLLKRLQAHPRVRMHGPMSYEQYRALLAEGGVALDLMAYNMERELAFTTRTVVYLSLGLPVVHDDYSELGRLIAQAGAGWAIPHDDPAAARELLTRTLRGDIDLAPHAQAAHRLVAEHLNWDATVAPLTAFCKAPAFREGKQAADVGVDFDRRQRQVERSEREREQAQTELDTLRGKRWVRWGLALTGSRGWLRLPAALAMGVLGILLWPIFAINDRLGKS